MPMVWRHSLPVSTAQPQLETRGDKSCPLVDFLAVPCLTPHVSYTPRQAAAAGRGRRDPLPDAGGPADHPSSAITVSLTRSPCGSAARPLESPPHSLSGPSQTET